MAEIETGLRHAPTPLDLQRLSRSFLRRYMPNNGIFRKLSIDGSEQTHELNETPHILWDTKRAFLLLDAPRRATPALSLESGVTILIASYA